MIAPPNMGGAYGRRFAEAYRNVAERQSVPLYPFFLEGVAAVWSLNQGDGIHPNPAGVDKIVANLLPSLRRFLEAG